VRAATLSWLAVLVVAAALLAATRYQPPDPDSRAYIDIAARLADQPVSSWVAPEWRGAWEREGLFREHPPGIFLVPALVARAGYPAKQSLLLVNSACQALCLILAAILVARFVPSRLAPLTASLLQLMPVAFVYRIRGNQEYPMLAALLVALYATDRARERWPWALVAVAAFAAGALIKGVFALLFPIICALWLLARRHDGAGAGGWAAVAGMVVAAPLLAVGYETAYRAATGESFFDYYLGERVSLEAASETVAGAIARKAYNLAWYSSRLEPGGARAAVAPQADRRRHVVGRPRPVLRDSRVGRHRCRAVGARYEGRPLHLPRLFPVGRGRRDGRVLHPAPLGAARRTARREAVPRAGAVALPVSRARACGKLVAAVHVLAIVSGPPRVRGD
jgi:hypothetical protein